VFDVSVNSPVVLEEMDTDWLPFAVFFLVLKVAALFSEFVATLTYRFDKVPAARMAAWFFPSTELFVVLWPCGKLQKLLLFCKKVADPPTTSNDFAIGYR